MEQTSARERLYRAEAQFEELMQGSKDLLDQDGTLYRFADGTEVRGVEAAAREAERLLKAARDSMNGA